MRETWSLWVITGAIQSLVGNWGKLSTLKRYEPLRMIHGLEDLRVSFLKLSKLPKNYTEWASGFPSVSYSIQWDSCLWGRFFKWSVPSGSMDSCLCLLFICKRGLGSLLFIDCWLFNHLRPTYGISDLALVRNPFPDGDITGELQRRAMSKEGNNKDSRSVWMEGKLIQHFSLHWVRACVFANVPFSKVLLLCVPGDFISHGGIWEGPHHSLPKSTFLVSSK